jgi:endo-1,4-beta-xylanase
MGFMHFLVRNKLFVLFGLLVGVVLGFNYIQPEDPYLHMAPPELPTPSLRELAEDRKLELGNFASLKYLRERPYSELLRDEFSFVMADGEPNWKFEEHTLRPSRNRYDFRDLDQVMVFAEENNKPVRVQHLLWGDEKWLPEWLKKGGYSKKELHGIIEDHIRTVVKRYKGQVREYTVVNEAFSRSLEKGGNKDWWGTRLGQEYIDKAFITARQEDPEAKLILNDFGNERINDVSNLMYKYIKEAKARGVPIDGIGLQMHINGLDAPTKEEVVKNMRRFKEIGVQVYVTEFDVNMHGFEGSAEDRNKQQAKVYSDMLSACLEVGNEICPSFAYLGLIDRQSWYKGIGLTDALPLMFEDDYDPKPAFWAVRETLKK